MAGNSMADTKRERLRLAFMGTPDFAVPALAALAEAGHEIAAVYSQPPRPSGRGHKTHASPVQGFAEEKGWPVATPRSLKGAEEQQAFSDLDLDAAVVVAYGLLLPEAVLAAPRLGCFNIHASLLPRWRGAAPIQRAILAGDSRSGVTIMKMDTGLDTGPMVLQRSLPVTATTTGESLHDALSELGAAAIVKALGRVVQAPEEALTPQPEEGVTYAAKLNKSEGELDWRQAAAALERRVRAFSPWPGAWFRQGDLVIKVLRSEVLAGKGAVGTLLDDRLTVACGEGALRLLEVQRPGKRPMTAEAFLRGFELPRGSRLLCPATS